MKMTRGILVAALFATTSAYGALTMPEIPVQLPESIRQPLIAKRQPLAQHKLALIDAGKALNSRCSGVKTGSSEHTNCLADKTKYDAEVGALSKAMDGVAAEIDIAIRSHTITSMNALAKRLGWSVKEQARLATALGALDSDGTDGVTSGEIRQAWQDVLGRDESFAREASNGQGPGFPGAGAQTRYQDCAVFALANAAGLPYGAVAARAADLIGKGEWRGAAERSDPQKSMEQGGLTGGEVVMLTESFGQVEVVNSTAFAKTLSEGRSVMVNVVPASGNVHGGHEVVLTKTFQHGGDTWYEMIDSNQGPVRRLYVSTKELGMMLQENGVAYQAEPGTTARLLR